MQEFIPILKNTRLFVGVTHDEISGMLSCLGARTGNYRKGEYVIRQGEHSDEIIVLVKGSLYIQNDDYWGNRSILARISEGEMLAEAYAFSDGNCVLNDVVAKQDSTVIFFNVKRILTTCSCACHFHSIIVQNLFFSISEKNRHLVQKLSHMSKRTTREKLISYLSEQAKKQNNSEFTIPFNRQQLADYLSVDRSAMSNELSKMQKEGLLKLERNSFKLF